VDPGVDHVRLARLLRRAHEIALDGGRAPSLLRSVVASSWRRATDQGIDPEGFAPTMLDGAATERALAESPVSPYLPLIKQMLGEAIEGAEYFAVLADRDGMLLWIDGDSRALDLAAGPRFLPGHLCSEGAVGTNAVGTALALDHPVQIFSAEHFNRRLHGLTCAAAPIRDPESGSTVAVLNLSGSFRTNHPHSLSLVTAVARVIQDSLAHQLARRDEELKARYIELLSGGLSGRSALVSRTGRVLAAVPRGWLGSRLPVGAGGELRLPTGSRTVVSPLDDRGDAMLVQASDRAPAPPRPTVAIAPLGPDRAEVLIGEWRTELSPRHSQLLILLATHPAGLSAERLRRLVYGSRASTVTVRAEISRLRRLLGPVLASNPYRIEAEVEADPEELRHLLDPAAGDRRA
jgi:hypothetical protein